MADNVNIKDAAAATVTVATNDLGAGVHAQVIQLLTAAATSANDVLPGDATYGLRVNQGTSATATLANVAGSASSVTLQASNVARLGLVVFNDSSATCYLKFGSAASATSFTYLLAGGATWEMQSGGARYTGIVTGIWTSATGNARVTELTA